MSYKAPSGTADRSLALKNTLEKLQQYEQGFRNILEEGLVRISAPMQQQLDSIEAALKTLSTLIAQDYDSLYADTGKIVSDLIHTTFSQLDTLYNTFSSLYYGKQAIQLYDYGIIPDGYNKLIDKYNELQYPRYISLTPPLNQDISDEIRITIHKQHNTTDQYGASSSVSSSSSSLLSSSSSTYTIELGTYSAATTTSSEIIKDALGLVGHPPASLAAIIPQYVLRVRGMTEYLYDNYRTPSLQHNTKSTVLQTPNVETINIIYFLSVRESIRHRKPLVLDLVKRDNVPSTSSSSTTANSNTNPHNTSVSNNTDLERFINLSQSIRTSFYQRLGLHAPQPLTTLQHLHIDTINNPVTVSSISSSSLSSPKSPSPPTLASARGDEISISPVLVITDSSHPHDTNMNGSTSPISQNYPNTSITTNLPSTVINMNGTSIGANTPIKPSHQQHATLPSTKTSSSTAGAVTVADTHIIDSHIPQNRDISGFKQTLRQSFYGIDRFPGPTKPGHFESRQLSSSTQGGIKTIASPAPTVRRQDALSRQTYSTMTLARGTSLASLAAAAQHAQQQPGQQQQSGQIASIASLGLSPQAFATPQCVSPSQHMRSPTIDEDMPLRPTPHVGIPSTSGLDQAFPQSSSSVSAYQVAASTTGGARPSTANDTTTNLSTSTVPQQPIVQSSSSTSLSTPSLPTTSTAAIGNGGSSATSSTSSRPARPERFASRPSLANALFPGSSLNDFDPQQQTQHRTIPTSAFDPDLPFFPSLQYDEHLYPLPSTASSPSSPDQQQHQHNTKERLSLDDESLYTFIEPPTTLCLTSQLPHTSFPSLRVTIDSAYNVTQLSLPRLYGIKRQFSRLYVATCLVHGDSIRWDTVSATRQMPFAHDIRWDQRILPNSKPLSINNILRSSRIAFILVGQYKYESRWKDVPLAWCTKQIFNENGEIIQGKIRLHLWPLPNQDEAYLSSPLLQQHKLLHLGASAELVELKEQTDISTELNDLSLSASSSATSPSASALSSPKDNKDNKKESKESKKETVARLNREKQLHDLESSLTKVHNIDLNLQTYIFRGTSSHNTLYKRNQTVVLSISFDSYLVPPILELEDPVLYPEQYVSQQPELFEESLRESLTKDQVLIADSLDKFDALSSLSDSFKKVVWLVRQTLVSKPRALPFVLQSVDWTNPEHHIKRWDVYKLLKSWASPQNPVQIISLLDYKYADYRIRQYAVHHLYKLHCSDIQLYLLQLVQCIKYEPYHVSPLSQCLITKAIQHPYQIGHPLYWLLKNEIQCDPPFAERYQLMLDAFLSFCPIATDQLRLQQILIDKLSEIATNLQTARRAKTPDDVILEMCKEQIHNLNFHTLSRFPQGRFQIPVDPRWESTKIIPEKCKVMSSKMAPLWLPFDNASLPDAKRYVIFKCGDDLRQDILTLQILRFMDNIWLQAGLDLRLTPYNVVATGVNSQGKGIGLIEVVLDSLTTAGIQRKYGGGATAAFDTSTIAKYIHDCNQTPELKEVAIDNFVHSCAGYCVATYVLGIGDRHNDNIMMTGDGHLLHIDFGHFLGNFKKKFGLNRERAPFVFTPEMAYAMGGKGSPRFKQFVDLCKRAFLQLRRYAVELESLFITMVSAGMPELLQMNDILYLRMQLCLDLTDEKASDEFYSAIKKALGSTSRRFDNFIHLIKHG